MLLRFVTMLLFAGVLAPAAFGQYTVIPIAGGGPPNGAAATSIALSYTYGVAVDTSGNLYVPSSSQNRVYKVATTGAITTVAGNGTSGYSGDNGPAASAQLNSPESVAVDSSGNVYIADEGDGRIRKVSGGVITTVAGGGNGCSQQTDSASDGCPATSAQLYNPRSIAVDSAGNLYIADAYNYRIRKVSVSSGVINSVAGDGTYGYSGDNGPATSAQFQYPGGVAVDSAGNLYIADTYNYRVRKVSASNGVITTVAGNGTYGSSGDNGPATSAELNPAGIAVDNSGNLYIADESYSGHIRKVSGGLITTVAGGGTGCAQQTDSVGDGCPATSARLYYPSSVTVDSAGNLYIADESDYRIRKVSASGGVITTVAGNGAYGYSGDNGPAMSAQVNPAGLAADNMGNLYIADYQDYRIRKVAGGTMTTAAGNGICCYSGDNGPAASAGLGNTSGVAVDGAGNLYIADSNRIRKILGGVITTVAGNGMYGYSGDGGPATSAQLGSTGGIAVDSSGNIYLTDATNNRVRKVSGGVITVVAGGGPLNGATATSIALSYVYDVAVDTSGNVYVPSSSQNRVYKVAANGAISTVAGNGTSGYSGDNGPASTAQLDSPGAVSVDSAGNLYIADSYNNRIRKVSASSGVITTVAGGGLVCAQHTNSLGDGCPATSALLSDPQGVAVDSAGNLYIADSYNYRIRKVSASSGVITTVAGTGTYGYSGDGGLAASAQLSEPLGVAVDSAGNLYIADAANNRIREVSVSSGVITTVAGNGAGGSSGDNGPATSAQFDDPSGVAVDGAGNLYIADSYNGSIRKVSGGVITTVAGGVITTGSGCAQQTDSIGDGCPPTSVQLYYPRGVAVDSAGNLYIADAENYRIRKVSGGVITTIAGNGSYSYSGDGGPALNAQFYSPSALAVDKSGNLYISDSGNNLVRVVSSGGTIATLAGGGTQGPGDGGLATSASLYNPAGLAVDGLHNVYIEDSGNGRLRKVTGGVIATVATIAGIQSYAPGGGGVAVDGAGNVYVSDPSSDRVLLVTLVPPTYNISGQVTASGTGLSGVTVTLTGAQNSSTTTDSSGSYLFNGLAAGSSYTVTPSRGGYTFNPASQTFSSLSGNQIASFTASSAYTISGQVTVSGGGLSGVFVVLSGSASGSATTDGLGNYSFTGLPAGASYTVTPFRSGYLFSPASQTFTLSGNQAANFSASVASLAFYSVTPCRLVDTRSIGGLSGSFGPPSMGAGEIRTIPIPANNACGIPATAQAYWVNITVVPKGPLAYLTVWPTGLSQPAVSTLNSLDGSVVANAAAVPAGANGSISVYVTNASDLIIDISGYFAPLGSQPGKQALAFYPVTPCRVADTRPFGGKTGAFGPPSMARGQTRAFSIPSSACGNLSAAQAYSLNMTVVPPGPLSYLSTWPAGQVEPVVSTLNSFTGRVVANAAVVPAGTSGAINVYVSDPTDLIIDINGYFAPPGSGGYYFYPLAPCRVADTRSFGGFSGAFGPPTMSAGSSRSFPLPSSSCAIPSTAQAYSLNVTVQPPGPLTYLSAWPTGQLQPVVSTLNSFDGRVVANAALVPAGTNGSINVYVSDSTDVIMDANGYFAP